MANTPQKGQYRWIVFKKGKNWIAAVLEFNIVEVADDPHVAYYEMQEAATGYIETAQKLRGFRSQTVNSVLNQDSDPEYEQIWNDARRASERKHAVPKNIFGFGVRSLATVQGMPRGLLNWTFADVRDFIRPRGFQLDHVRGSHHFFRRLYRNRIYIVQVAYHGSKSIPPDTMRSIINQSGIPKEEWLGE